MKQILHWYLITIIDILIYRQKALSKILANRIQYTWEDNIQWVSKSILIIQGSSVLRNSLISYTANLRGKIIWLVPWMQRKTLIKFNTHLWKKLLNNMNWGILSNIVKYVYFSLIASFWFSEETLETFS